MDLEHGEDKQTRDASIGYKEESSDEDALDDGNHDKDDSGQEEDDEEVLVIRKSVNFKSTVFEGSDSDG